MLRFNENNEVITEEKYRAILVGIELSEDISYSMEELKGLAEADNIEVLASMVQKVEKRNTATLIGSGKVKELAEMVKNMEADTVLFNDELTGMQLRNIEDAVGVRVIDRTILILDIFADRANSKEGKLQVEMAQLQYRMPRLTGFGKSLSRLGGGIGTRGPGEKKLETDRRHIEKRIDEIKSELKDIKANREVQRAKREKNEIPVVALVGYTNSGKSALMNQVLNKTYREDKDSKSVFEKNMLFATLDTFQRNITLDSNHEFILVDTVGFVSKLPHSLVNAFKSTLEEVATADLLIHVVDSSYDNHDFQIEVTEKVLSEIGADGKEKIICFNKIDLLENIDNIVPVKDAENMYISAKYDKNVDELIELIKKHIFNDRIEAKLIIPYTRGDLSSFICDNGDVHVMDYRENGTYFEVELKIKDYGKLKEYEVI